jgi:hypothetical protein
MAQQKILLESLGKLLTLRGKEEELDRIQALTKWVPQPQTITRSIVKYVK